MKWIHLSISIIFLSFAGMQWNDGDAIVWILMYLAVAAVALLAFRQRHYFYINATLTIILLISFFTYIPELREWTKDGMPSITTSMQASSPYIELVRESLGLLISLATMIYYFIQSQPISK